MIQTYYGNGKGKTTAAIGGAIRSAGCGYPVLFVSFLKNNTSAEFHVLTKLPAVTVMCSDVCYQLYDNQNELMTEKFMKAYTTLFETVQNNCQSYRMIILDEVLDAIDFGYLNEEALIRFIQEQKDDKEWILTGHKLSENIKEISDYLTEIKAVKHPYDRGISSRKGIEY